MFAPNYYLLWAVLIVTQFVLEQVRENFVHLEWATTLSSPCWLTVYLKTKWQKMKGGIRCWLHQLFHQFSLSKLHVSLG